MTTMETLYTGLVPDIAALVEACHFPSDSYVLVERQPKTIIEQSERQNLLRFARLKDGIEIGSYTSGRVFKRDFELRWEQDAVIQGQTSVVYIGVERELPGLKKSEWTVQPDDEGKDKDKERKYYLFGERLDLEKQSKMGIEPQEGYEYYAETRIPRLLSYPVVKEGQQPERLQLVASEYRLIGQNGEEQGRTYRFLDLIEAKE